MPTMGVSVTSGRAGGPFAVVVMGVSGSGKSSVGERLAARFGLPFLEGDALHPAANVEKMSKSIPLTDEDRMPWLDTIGGEIAEALARGSGIVVSCSALKRKYRDRLRAPAGGRLSFVYLEGSQALLTERLGMRRGHFMPAALLGSQLKALEVPTGEPGVITVNIGGSIDDIVDAAARALTTIR
jgi:gluconokinase